MKWTTILFTLILIHLAAGDGAWRQNQEYKYKLEAKTFIPSATTSNNELVGVVSRAQLSIRPQSDNLLMGQITKAEYVEVNKQLSPEWSSNLNENELAYYQWPLNKPFKIHLQNGAISSLSVDRELTNYQINQLKVVISQFQSDTKAEYEIETSDNQLPDEDDNNAFYKTMEPLVTGNCETFYDISPLTDYMIQANPDWVPLPELKGDGEFILISKSRNSTNCNEHSPYHLDITGHKDVESHSKESGMSLSEVRRIVISGSLKNYTIQSAFTTILVTNSDSPNSHPALYDYIILTLESVEQNTSNIQIASENLIEIGNLVYTYDSQYARQMNVTLQPRKDSKPEEKWSACWTSFPIASTVCKIEFGPEYLDITRENCGFLGLGMTVLCRFKYPGCKATPCFSAFYPRHTLCQRTFGEEYPTTRLGFADCSPGFYRSRCCPPVYE